MQNLRRGWHCSRINLVILHNHSCYVRKKNHFYLTHDAGNIFSILLGRYSLSWKMCTAIKYIPCHFYEKKIQSNFDFQRKKFSLLIIRENVHGTCKSHSLNLYIFIWDTKIVLNAVKIKSKKKISSITFVSNT